MGGRPITERAAAVAMALEALGLAAVVGGLILEQGAALASPDPHLQGDAEMAFLVVGVPFGAGAIVVGVAAGRLWRGLPGARTVGWLLVPVGLVAGATIRLAGYLDAVWAAWTAVTSPASLRVVWPRLYDAACTARAGTPLDACPSAPILSVYFWWPLVTIAGWVLIALLLAASLRRGRGREAGEAGGASRSGGAAWT
jgi:hypothetical protein